MAACGRCRLGGAFPRSAMPPFAIGAGRLHKRPAPMLLLMQRGLLNGCVSEKVLVDGCVVHVDRVGSGPHALLLLPGALGSSRTDFGPQLEHLSRERFTIYAWDPPGYGLSIPPERSWPKDFLRRDADAAAKVIRALVPGPKAVSLLGWSDGGITALILAVAYPELVHKLVVWGANAFVTKLDLELYEKLRDVRSWSSRMREPYEKLYGAEYFERHWHGWIDAMARYLTEADGDIIKSKVHLVECPTLIVHGAEDQLVPAEHPEFLRARIRHSRLVTMPLSKHNLHLRFSSAFNELITDFLLR